MLSASLNKTFLSLSLCSYVWRFLVVEVTDNASGLVQGMLIIQSIIVRHSRLTENKERNRERKEEIYKRKKEKEKKI